MQVRLVLFFLSAFLMQSVFCSEKKQKVPRTPRLNGPNDAVASPVPTASKRVSLVERLSKGGRLKKEADFQRELQQLIKESQESDAVPSVTPGKSVKKVSPYSEKSTGRGVPRTQKRIINTKKSKTVRPLDFKGKGAGAAKVAGEKAAAGQSPLYKGKGAAAARVFIEAKGIKFTAASKQEERNND